MDQNNNEKGMQEYKIFDSQYPLPHHKSNSRTKNDILMRATILFAKQGYEAVSMRDIAGAVDIQAASLYNHFNSKETLWKAVLDHAKDLYLLFFEQMEMQIKKASDFEEVIQIIFEEPEKMSNPFTCYAFALIQAEQFRDEYAYEICNDYLIKYAIDFIKNQLDNCIAKGFVSDFDTLTVANMYTNSVLIGINISVQKLMGRPIPFEAEKMIANLHQYFLETINIKR